MSTRTGGLSRWTVGGGASILVITAALLLEEFFEPGQIVWNVFLIACLVGMLIAAVLLTRFFHTHADQIGEARFDTRNESDVNG